MEIILIIFDKLVDTVTTEIISIEIKQKRLVFLFLIHVINKEDHLMYDFFKFFKDTKKQRYQWARI